MSVNNVKSKSKPERWNACVLPSSASTSPPRPHQLQRRLLPRVAVMTLALATQRLLPLRLPHLLPAAWLSLTCSSWSAPRQALLLVWDSRQPASGDKHRQLAQILKEARAEGQFAAAALEPGILVYDRAIPSHASSLKVLGLSKSGIPAICIVEMDKRGLPSKVAWSKTYASGAEAKLALDQKLGLSVAPKEPPVLVLVGQDPLTEAKLKALLAGSWKSAPIQSFRQVDSLPSVNGPALALTKADGSSYWNRDLSAPDGALTALGSRFGLTYAAPDGLRWEKDGSELLRVAGNRVTVGHDPEPGSSPRHTMDLGFPYYYVGKTEVTVGQFRRFVEATGYQTDAERVGRAFIWMGDRFGPQQGANWKTPRGDNYRPSEQMPVVQVTQSDALKYCEWAGLRLPSEREWEQAAGSGRAFPWGDNWDPNRLRHSVGGAPGQAGGPMPVGSYPSGASPWGLLDMAGNASEWTSSRYIPYTETSPKLDRMNGLRVVIRGGSFGANESRDFLTWTRVGVGAQDPTEAQGFRVCISGVPRQP